ncbi:helicase MOV-10 [Varanus komodoensis]|uniref:helicase MOV-10 n=1 Tax=Varanus komodoensis TaxID=61221 RepID=UPI001CF7DC89|nr:helicase MOV-10 [Varanus komodoensis]
MPFPPRISDELTKTLLIEKNQGSLVKELNSCSSDVDLSNESETQISVQPWKLITCPGQKLWLQRRSVRKRTIKQIKEAGEQFVQFLQDTGKEAETNREALANIYNQEFRSGPGGDIPRRPKFSSVLLGLMNYNSATVNNKSVQFAKGKKMVQLTDQYWKPRNEARDKHAQDQGPGAGPYSCRSHAKARAEFVSEKHGVDIVSPCDQGNGRIRVQISPNTMKEISIEIKNCGTNEVTLCKCKKRKRREVTMVPSESLPRQLPPGMTYKMMMRCESTYYGYFPVTVTFEFTSEQTGSFVIARFVSVVVNSKLAEQLGPSAPYQPYQAKLRRPQFVITEKGVRTNISWKNYIQPEIPLGKYNYPAPLKNSLKYLNEDLTLNNSTRKQVDRLLRRLKSPLQFDNYPQKFHLLLHLEEIQMEVDIHRYDMDNVPLMASNDRNLLVLKVPGVAENRPSVLKGDHLFVTLTEERMQDPVIRYQGYVHEVELENVKLGFPKKLLSKFIKNMKFDVTFTFNRLPLRSQHRAVFLARKKKLQHLLFPSLSYEKSLLSAGQCLNLHDRKLEENEQQKRAIYQVVAGTSRPAPYLIFGPPGTGKTVTMVEAIKQVLCCIEDSHVLACAPSNSACDLLCQLLMKHVEKRNIYRFNAKSREYYTIPDDIKPLCNWDKIQNCVVFPGKETLKNYRVIITTLVPAGRLVTADFPPGHFSHVFIDESGQACETESLIAIAGILTMMDPKTNAKGGQLVLAGDPKQLGPVLRSPLAIEHGLGLSLLERLMQQNSLYQKKDGSYNSTFITKLLRNYRSHAAILKFPNEKFYDGELQVCADHCISHSYCTWKELVKQDFPIIFHGVCGEDLREERSPSFFNTAEITILIDYLKELLPEEQGKKGQSRTSPKDIGIITPYRKQVQKIRQAVKMELKNQNDIKDLKIGTVEEFQGQERLVILISTVRSNSDYFDMDNNFSIGFLKNPKRFNVAVTRAKALLIIIGNPITLSKDVFWGEFLTYCRNNGGYRGYPYVEDENEGDE